jgi:hypothetical protein
MCIHTFDGMQESMSKSYIAWLNHTENLHVHNTSHGTINTKIEIKEIPKAFSCISVVRMSLHVTVYKAPEGAWKLKIPSSFNDK